MGGEGGPKCKMAIHPLPPIAKQGRGAGSPAAANPAAPDSGGGRGPGEKREGGSGNRSPASPRAMVACSSGATGAGGGGREWLRRRRCGPRGEARVGGEVAWMAVELGGGVLL